jgi:hypothetical protein
VEADPSHVLAQVGVRPVGQGSPPGFVFRHGLLDFQVIMADRGVGTTVNVHLGTPGVVDTYYKLGRLPQDDPTTDQDETQPHWHEFLYDGVTGAEFFDSAGQPVPPHTRGVVARIALHFVDGQRGDLDIAANGIIADPGGPAEIQQAPAIERVVINDGHAQRSMVSSLTVHFDSLVAVESGAFQLRLTGMKKPVDVQVALSEIEGRTVARLTFRGPAVQHGSLKDGEYTLTILASKIRDAAGHQLDGDGDGDAGGNRVDEFFRLFGDTNGDGDVDWLDAEVLSATFGKRSRDPGYLWYLDFNDNGRVWAEDVVFFLLNALRRRR